VVFDETTGDVVVDVGRSKVSELGRRYESSESLLERPGGGIDIAQAREVLRAEDKFDREAERQRNKEKRREMKLKAKEEAARKRKQEEEDESDSEESVDLSWLPDPDKVNIFNYITPIFLTDTRTGTYLRVSCGFRETKTVVSGTGRSYWYLQNYLINFSPVPVN
jgi:hypothetical protein